MPLIDRLGMESGMQHVVADGLRWAAPHGRHAVDGRLDTSPEACDAFTPERCAAIDACLLPAPVLLALGPAGEGLPGWMGLYRRAAAAPGRACGRAWLLRTTNPGATAPEDEEG